MHTRKIHEHSQSVIAIKAHACEISLLQDCLSISIFVIVISNFFLKFCYNNVMANSDYTKDEDMFEKLFKDRFTEKDIAYYDLKSKPLSAPTVVYPWKLKKQWFKSWDYSRDRHNRDRNRSRYDRDSYSNHTRDRSRDAESSQYRDRHRDGRDSYHQRQSDRDEEKDNKRGYHRERD